MRRRMGGAAGGEYVWPFGFVSAREKNDADLFYRQLTGDAPPVTLPRGMWRVESFDPRGDRIRGAHESAVPTEDATEDQARKEVRDYVLDAHSIGGTFLSK